MPILAKMEWFYALRKVTWSFLRHYHLFQGITAEEVFELSDRISDALDNFIIYFNVSFTKYRDEIIKSKQAIIDELNVPIIPIFNQIAVLPLIGTLDGTAAMSTDTFNLLNRIIEGINLLGCQAVLTGITAKLAKLILNMGDGVNDKLTVEGTLQQALAKQSVKQSVL